MGCDGTYYTLIIMKMESIYINTRSMQVELLWVVVVQERVVEQRVGEWVWFFLADLLAGRIWLDEDRADSLDECLAFIFGCLHCLALHLPSMMASTPILALVRLLPALLRKLLNDLLVKVLIQLVPLFSDDPMWEFVFGLIFLVVAAALC